MHRAANQRTLTPPLSLQAGRGRRQRDPATAALLSWGDTLGVFQAESPGMRHLCRQMRVASREDLTVALSVIRPGPAASGMKAAYIRRRLGQELADYLHPKLAKLLGRTFGVMIYQEDTMRAAVGVAGFTPAEADMLRKAVSKKRSPQRMAQLRQRFLDKAARHTPDLSPAAAAELWEQIAKFASYSFCRAHACVYGRIAWRTAFLKAHHPSAFYTAVFNNHMGMYPMRVHVADAIRHGVRVLGPDVNASDADCTLGSLGSDGSIRLGLNFVFALSAASIGRIVAHRPFASLGALRLAAKLSEPELVNLIRCGACDALGSNRRALLAEAALESPIGELIAAGAATPAGEESPRGAGDLPNPARRPFFKPPARPGDSDVFKLPASSGDSVDGGKEGSEEGSSRFPWARPFSPVETLQGEIDVLGLFLSAHPMELARGDWVTTDRLAEFVGRRIVVAGILDATRTVQTAAGKLMRFVTLEDQAGLVECTFFPEAYRRFGHLFYHVGPFRVAGVVEDDRGVLTVRAEHAEPLVDACPIQWHARPPANEWL